VQIDHVADALEHDELRLHFQPKVDLRQGSVFGVEALVRWQHRQQGLLAPGAFLPGIEGHGLQYDVDWWVLQRALEATLRWRAKGLELAVSINVHPHTILQADFTARLAELVRASGVPGSMIELEILESEAIDDLDAIAAVIRECAQSGVAFALDDYGTGYSSLNHIRRLPVKTLKIDQSFVRDMLKDRDDFNIVEGVIGLARAFEREVIAEGVESAEVAKRLLDLGCHLAQGYGIARPMPEAELVDWVRRYAFPPEWGGKRLSRCV